MASKSVRKASTDRSTLILGGAYYHLNDKAVLTRVT